MRNAPWNNDDVEVLREKWRLANEYAMQFERMAQNAEIWIIRLRDFPKDPAEFGDALPEARWFHFQILSQLPSLKLAMPDLGLFVDQNHPKCLEEWNRLSQEILEAAKSHSLLVLFEKIEQLAESIANVTRDCASAIQSSLSAWKEADPRKPSWFRRVDNGVEIHGKLVDVRGRDADLLIRLCQRTGRRSTYEDLAEVSDTWVHGLDSTCDQTIETAQKNIRSSISKINKALRETFGLDENSRPVSQPERARGWKLNKELLSTNSQ